MPGAVGPPNCSSERAGFAKDLLAHTSENLSFLLLLTFDFLLLNRGYNTRLSWIRKIEGLPKSSSESIGIESLPYRLLQQILRHELGLCVYVEVCVCSRGRVVLIFKRIGIEIEVKLNRF